jgi:hypothetical protein
VRKSTPYMASLALGFSLCSCSYENPAPHETLGTGGSSSIQTAAPTPTSFTMDPGYVPGLWGDLDGEGGVRLLEERGLRYRVLESLGPGSGYGTGKEVDISAGLHGWKIQGTLPTPGKSVDVKAGEPVLIYVERITPSASASPRG